METQEISRLAFDKNPLPMWVYDVETLAFLAVNDAAVRQYGYSRKEFLSMTVDRIRPQEDVALFLEHSRKPHRHYHKSGVWRHRTKDGAVLDVDVVVSELPFEGRPGRLVMCHDVTGQRRMETSLRESEARLRTYLESASEGILVVNREGLIEFVNAKTEEIFGYRRGELIGKTMEVLLPERYRAKHAAYRQSLVAGPRVRPMGSGMELTGLRKDGAELPLEVGLSAVEADGGVVQVAFLNDITTRKQAEAALRESEQRFRNLVETTSDLVWEIDASYRFTYVSPRIREMLGYEPEDAIGKTRFDLMPREEARRVRKEYRSAARSARSLTSFETTVLDRSGQPVQLETNAVPFFGADGTLLGYRGIDRNITERKHAVEALRESEASLARAQRIVHLGNWEEDMATGDLRWSDEVYHIFQLDKEALAGASLREQFFTRVHPDDRATVRRAVELATRSGKPYSLDHRLVLPDGSERYVREHAEVLRDAAGRVRLVGTVQDITEYKRLEEQLRQAQRMEAVGRLAGGVAHDFNNLLTIISGYGELLATQLPAQSPQRRDLDEIIHAGERAASLTRQLLAFSRRQVLQLKVLDLNAIVADLDKMLRRLIGEDIELVTVLDPELSATHADPTQIEQVIMNLAVNARDAMPVGGRLLIETANVELDENYTRERPEMQPGSYVMLAVTDNGAGMSAEVMSHAFEPFFTTKPREKGTGLGLSTVYGIVKQSGGSIFVYSELEHGTTFKIYLPCAEESVSASGPAPASRPAGGAETILLVEDEAGVRTLIRTILETGGYTVLEADRGARALELLRACQAPPDLVITDVVMPEMSGKELVEKARAMFPGLQVLFISGYTDEAVVHHAGLTAGLPFLQKPFTHDALTQRIRELLDAGGTAASGR